MSSSSVIRSLEEDAGLAQGAPAQRDEGVLRGERVELDGPDVAVAALDDRALEVARAADDLHGEVAHLEPGAGDLALGGHHREGGVDAGGGVVADGRERAVER